MPQSDFRRASLLSALRLDRWAWVLFLAACGPTSSDTSGASEADADADADTDTDTDTPTAEDCDDGIDNDGDGYADCEDPDCDCYETDASWPPLRINEFMASNQTTIADELGAYPDWVELYNPTDETVYLGGYTLTDDLEEPDKVTLDDALSIPPGGFLLLWADSDPEEGPTHIDFNLAAAGEDLGLFAPDGEALDTLSYLQQATDISAARAPDGADTWTADPTPTPGASNGDGS